MSVEIGKPLTPRRDNSSGNIGLKDDCHQNNMSLLHITMDVEDPNMQKMIDDLNSVTDAGPAKLDVPLPGGFASTIIFWKVAILAAFLGLLLGLLASFFLNIADETPKQWTNNDEFSDASSFDPFSGELYWIAIPTGGGILIGLIRYFSSFPDSIDGMFQEIQEAHVDYHWSPYIYFISMISLACGATLGPEAGLGNVGGGIATYLTTTNNNMKWLQDWMNLSEDYKKLSVLAGMSAALGSLFPTPILSVMIMFELGPHPPRQLIECITITAISAVTAFAVTYSMIGVTWMEYLSQTLYKINAIWDFEINQLGVAFVIGLVSAALGLILLITIGISRQFFNRLRIGLRTNINGKIGLLLSAIVPPAIGGVMIGITNYCLPMTVGNGSMVLSTIVSATLQGHITDHLLICSAFARIALLGISMNCGFVGGFIYPMITIGLIAGMLTYEQYKDHTHPIPLGLCLTCFMAAITGCLAPIPYTFCSLFVMMFSLGPYQASTVFVSVMTSYTVLSGSGFLSMLQRKAAEREKGSVRRSGSGDGNKNEGVTVSSSADTTMSTTITAVAAMNEKNVDMKY